MKRFVRRSLSLFVSTWLVLTACSDASRSVIIAVDRSDLQEQVDQRFPMTNSTFLTSVTLEHPRVILADGSGRLGVGLDVAASLPVLGTVHGTVTVSGEPAYDPEGKRFFFHQPRLDTLNINGIGSRVMAAARQGIEATAQLALAEFPIYTLRQRTLREIAAEHVLKSVQVRGGKLYLELGLP